MATDDVLERANNYAATLRTIDDRRRAEGVAALDLIYALAAEVRELRRDKARLDWMLRNTNDDILSRMDLDAAMEATEND